MYLRQEGVHRGHQLSGRIAGGRVPDLIRRSLKVIPVERLVLSSIAEWAVKA